MDIQNEQPEISAKFPNAFSRKFTEGGYTFLHRVFRAHFATRQPVVIDSGGLYIQYAFQPDHNTFVEGLKILEGNNPETWEAFMSCARNFSLNTAFQENSINRPTSETRVDINKLLE